MKSIIKLIACAFLFSNALLAFDPHGSPQDQNIRDINELRGVFRTNYDSINDEYTLLNAAGSFDRLARQKHAATTEQLRHLLTDNRADYDVIDFILRTIKTKFFDNTDLLEARLAGRSSFADFDPSRDALMSALLLCGLRIKHPGMVRFALARLPKEKRNENNLLTTEIALANNQGRLSNKGIFHYLFEWFPRDKRVHRKAIIDETRSVIDVLLEYGFDINKTMKYEKIDLRTPWLAHSQQAYVRRIFPADLLAHEYLMVLRTYYPQMRDSNEGMERRQPPAQISRSNPKEVTTYEHPKEVTTYEQPRATRQSRSYPVKETKDQKPLDVIQQITSFLQRQHIDFLTVIHISKLLRGLTVSDPQTSIMVIDLLLDTSLNTGALLYFLAEERELIHQWIRSYAGNNLPDKNQKLGGLFRLGLKMRDHELLRLLQDLLPSLKGSDPQTSIMVIDLLMDTNLNTGALQDFLAQEPEWIHPWIRSYAGNNNLPDKNQKLRELFLLGLKMRDHELLRLLQDLLPSLKGSDPQTSIMVIDLLLGAQLSTDALKDFLAQEPELIHPWIRSYAGNNFPDKNQKLRELFLLGLKFGDYDLLRLLQDLLPSLKESDPQTSIMVIDLLLDTNFSMHARRNILARETKLLHQWIRSYAGNNFPDKNQKLRELFLLGLKIRDQGLVALIQDLLPQKLLTDKYIMERESDGKYMQDVLYTGMGVFNYLIRHFVQYATINNNKNARGETKKLIEIIKILKPSFDMNRSMCLHYIKIGTRKSITPTDQLLSAYQLLMDEKLIKLRDSIQTQLTGSTMVKSEPVPPSVADIIEQGPATPDDEMNGAISLLPSPVNNSKSTSKKRKPSSPDKGPKLPTKKRKKTTTGSGEQFFRIGNKYMEDAFKSSLNNMYFGHEDDGDEQWHEDEPTNHYQLSYNDNDVITIRNNINCERVEQANSFAFTYCWKKMPGENNFEDIRRRSTRYTFIMAGRKDFSVPQETDGGRVVLVLTRGNDLRIESLVKDRQDAMIIEALYSYSAIVPDREVSLVTSRRLSALYFAEKMKIPHLLMLDDNIKSVSISSDLVKGSRTTAWKDVYDFLATTTQQNSSLGILGLRGYDSRHDHAQPRASDMRLTNSISSKLYFINTHQVLARLKSHKAQVYHLLPKDLYFWGEDVFLNFAIRALKLKAMTIHRQAARYHRNKANVSSGDRNVCAKVVRDASNWIKDEGLLKFYGSDAGSKPSLDALKKMIKLVRKNYEHHRKEHDKFANIDLGEFTADKNLGRRPWYKDYVAPPISPETGPLSLTGLAINNESYLREYQKQAVGKLLEEHRARGYVEIATGAGKTRIILSTIASLKKYRQTDDVAIVVPTRELVEQIYQNAVNFGRNQEGKCVLDDQSLCLDVKRIIKVDAGNISAEDYYTHEYLLDRGEDAPGTLVILCQRSFHNLVGMAREDEMQLRFNQIFVDELHTIPDGREDIYTEAKNIFGFSATPGKQGPSIFKERLLEYGMEDAIRDGVLAPYSTYVLDDIVSRDDNMLTELPKKLKSILERHRYKKNNPGVPGVEELGGSNLPRGIIYVSNGGSSNVVDSLTAKLNEHYPSYYRAKGVLSSKGRRAVRKILNDFNSGNINVLVADRMLTMGFDAKVDYIVVLKNDVSLDNLIQMRGRSLRKHNDDNKVAALIVTKPLLNKIAQAQKDCSDITAYKIRYSKEYRLSKQGLHNAFKISKENKEWIKSYMANSYRKSGLKIKNSLDNFYLIATGRSTVGGFSLADEKPAVKSLFYDFADGAIDFVNKKLTSSRATVMGHQPLSFERAVANHQSDAQ